jgi:hypothetical protein
MIFQGDKIHVPAEFNVAKQFGWDFSFLFARLHGPTKAAAVAGSIIGVIALEYIALTATNPNFPRVRGAISAVPGGVLWGGIVGAICGRGAVATVRRLQQKRWWIRWSYGLIIGAMVGSISNLIFLVTVMAFALVVVLVMRGLPGPFSPSNAFWIALAQLTACGALVGLITAAVALSTRLSDRRQLSFPLSDTYLSPL